MWSNLTKMTKSKSMCLFLSLVNYLEIIILMNKTYEGEPNCTSTPKASAYIMSADILLVKLSHMTKSQAKWDRQCIPSALLRRTWQRTQRERWQLWTGNTNIQWQLRYFYSHFRDRETDTRDLTTVTSLKMAQLGLKPGHLILKHNKGVQ